MASDWIMAESTLVDPLPKTDVANGDAPPVWATCDTNDSVRNNTEVFGEEGWLFLP